MFFNFGEMFSHLFCTLSSENQGLEKLRSVSNLRKNSGPAHLDFFSVHLSFFQFVSWIFSGFSCEHLYKPLDPQMSHSKTQSLYYSQLKLLVPLFLDKHHIIKFLRYRPLLIKLFLFFAWISFYFNMNNSLFKDHP